MTDNAKSRGFVYPLALGIVFVLTIIGTSLLMRGVSETNLSERSRSQSAALHLAEAGVDQASRNLRTPTDTGDDVTSANLATGTFTIDAPPTSLGTNLWQVTTHGRSTADPNQPRNVEATFQVIPESIFQFALFGAQNLNVSGSAITDSYDSRAGAYDNDSSSPTYNAGHDGDVGTNTTTVGGVTVGGSIFIDGQVAVGPDVSNPTSVVTGYDPAFITGGTSPPSDTQDVLSQSGTFPMPAVIVPDGLVCSSHTVNGGDQETLSPTGGPLGNGTYCYNNLTVKGNATLTASGAVTVYLTGRLIAEGNSTIGVAANPQSMVFLMQSNSQATLEDTITGSTRFYGALYGPDATINIQGNADVYGSVIAETVNVTGSASIHYDEALTTDTHISNLYKTKLVSWREL